MRKKRGQEGNPEKDSIAFKIFLFLSNKFMTRNHVNK